MWDSVFDLKFRIQNLKIQEFEFWIVSLRPQQVTLGSMVLTLKRHCGSLSDLTEEEAGELSKIYKFIESKLKELFLPDRINYLTLMMTDYQLHTHIIPRYQSERIFNNIIFTDKDWPKPSNILDVVSLTDSQLSEIHQSFIF